MPHTRLLGILAIAIAVCGALPQSASAVDPAVVAAQKRRVEIVEKVASSVVAIFAPGGRGGGSGVLISPEGYTLTNFHVTQLNPFMKCGLNDGKVYDAVLVGVDPTGDVAMLKLLGRPDFPHAKLGDSDKLKAGDWAYAMGNPFLLATDFKPTVTYGLISGVHRYQYPAGDNILEYTDCIQIDTSINPGNSGGPLFNDAGELVGINGRGSFEKRGRVNSGAGYAISINQIKHFMGHLRSGRIVDHATLGATVETSESGAVVVSNILVESEAYRRGLEIGDVLVKFAGRPIRSVNQYKNVLGIYPKGWKLPLTFRRENKERTIYVRLRALHRSTAFNPTKKLPKPKPKRKPGGKKPIPIPRPKVPTVPAKYKHLHVKKTGYANYYFNEQERKRALRAMAGLGDYSQVAGNWLLNAKNEKGDAIKITLSDVFLVYSNEKQADPQLQDMKGAFVDVPKGSGGALAALHTFKLFLTQRENRALFPEFYYLGSEPLDGRGEPVDVVVTKYVIPKGDGIFSRWYFDPKDGRLLGFDTALEKDVDECQIRIKSWKEFDGRRFPNAFDVRHAEKLFATLTIDGITFGKADAKPKTKKN